MPARRVLLVDDDEFIHQLLGQYLEQSGFEVVHASDGLEGLRLAGEPVPDLILTDVEMPELNGHEFTRRLRAHYKTARIPIIMFSNLSTSKDVLLGYSEGADEYLPKPFELPILGAKIENLLRRSAGVPQAERQPGKVVLVMHGKGGVGTTTVVVNLAVAVALERASRVSLLDLNVEFGNAGVYMNLRPAFTLADLGSQSQGPVDDETFEQFVTLHEPSAVRVVVGCDVPERAEMVSVPAVQTAIDKLSAVSDFVFVDMPDSFTERTLAAIDVASLICVVTTPSLPSLIATKECLAVFQKLKIPSTRVAVLLNRLSAGGASFQKVSEFFCRAPDFSIERSENLDHAADVGKPLVLSHPEDAVSVELKAIASRLVTGLTDRLEPAVQRA